MRLLSVCQHCGKSLPNPAPPPCEHCRMPYCSARCRTAAAPRHEKICPEIVQAGGAERHHARYRAREAAGFAASTYGVDNGACALCGGDHYGKWGRDKPPEPLLRAAVWKLSFDYSALACGVVARGYGLDTLITWLLDPPLDATDEDVRRVGYAIGGIGGERAVEQLQKAFGTTAGAELPALVGAILGAYSARTR